MNKNKGTYRKLSHTMKPFPYLSTERNRRVCEYTLRVAAEETILCTSFPTSLPLPTISHLFYPFAKKQNEIFTKKN
jgi:hypothetical protein